MKIRYVTIVMVVLFLKQSWQGQTASSIISEMCGFLIILSGVTLLITTKELGNCDLFRISESLYVCNLIY